MEREFNYRIGLDIGIASVGWAVLQNNSQDEPVRIVDLGVRIFDKAEIPKTGESLAKKIYQVGDSAYVKFDACDIHIIE